MPNEQVKGQCSVITIHSILLDICTEIDYKIYFENNT